MARPWMPLFVADYLADTAHINAAESGAYLHLIMHYWQKGCLPDDDRKLSIIAKMTPDEFSNARATLAEFFLPGWRHKRIDKELEASNAAYERRAGAGKAGGEAKSVKNRTIQEHHSSNATAILPQNCSNAVATHSHSHSHKLVPTNFKIDPNDEPMCVSEKSEPTQKPISREKPIRDPKGTRLADDWVLPNHWGIEALSLGLTREAIRIEASRFADYWRSKPGPNAKKLDWQATWRNWCRDKSTGNPRAGPVAKPATFDKFDVIARNLHEYQSRNGASRSEHGDLYADEPANGGSGIILENSH